MTNISYNTVKNKGKEGRSSKTLAGYLMTKYGIGRSRSEMLCNELGFLPSMAFNKLSSENMAIVEMYTEVESMARETMIKNINKKVKLGTTQGIRRRLGRPVRGQRTHTNGSNARKLNAQLIWKR